MVCVSGNLGFNSIPFIALLEELIHSARKIICIWSALVGQEC